MKKNKYTLAGLLVLGLTSCTLIGSIPNNSDSDKTSTSETSESSSIDSSKSESEVNSESEITSESDNSSDSTSERESELSDSNSSENISELESQKESETSSDNTSEPIIDETRVIDNRIKKSNDLKEAFGDLTWYKNGDDIPYSNINLDEYGSDVQVSFYVPKTSNENPYLDYDATNYYTSSYRRATSYEDAQLRTKAGIISGIESEYELDDSHLPPDNSSLDKFNNNFIRSTSAYYVLNPNDGSYIAYVVPSLDGKDPLIIYYGGGYVSLNEEAAYLLAFGEVPPSSNYDKSGGKTSAISKWGKYGRVNNSAFSDDYLNSSFCFEPGLRDVYTNDNGNVKCIYSYNETDFGSSGGYTVGSYLEGFYNDGSSINRGAARFVFTSDKTIKSIDERSVFYTWNHYNDFQEYLNYQDGWGQIFGNCTEGREPDLKTPLPNQDSLYPYLVTSSIDDINSKTYKTTYSINQYVNGKLVNKMDVRYGVLLSSLTKPSNVSSSTIYRTSACNSNLIYIPNQVVNSDMNLYYVGSSDSSSDSSSLNNDLDTYVCTLYNLDGTKNDSLSFNFIDGNTTNSGTLINDYTKTLDEGVIAITNCTKVYKNFIDSTGNYQGLKLGSSSGIGEFTLEVDASVNIIEISCLPFSNSSCLLVDKTYYSCDSLQTLIIDTSLNKKINISTSENDENGSSFDKRIVITNITLK